MSDPARRESADGCRTKRVANLNDAINQLYRAAAHADSEKWEEAERAIQASQRFLEEARACLWDESEARERERRGETVHGEDTETSQMSIPGA